MNTYAADLHTHTIASGHAYSTIKEMAIAAEEKGIRLVAEDTGLNYGRTVELHCDTGEFLIKSVGKPIKTI